MMRILYPKAAEVFNFFASVKMSSDNFHNLGLDEAHEQHILVQKESYYGPATNDALREHSKALLDELDLGAGFVDDFLDDPVRGSSKEASRFREVATGTLITHLKIALEGGFEFSILHGAPLLKNVDAINSLLGAEERGRARVEALVRQEVFHTETPVTKGRKASEVQTYDSEGKPRGKKAVKKIARESAAEVCSSLWHDWIVCIFARSYTAVYFYS